MTKKVEKKTKISKKETTRNKFDIINYKKNYKKLMIIPLIMFLISSIIIFQTIQKESTPIYRDVTLKGGLSTIIYTQSTDSVESIQYHLQTSHKDYSFSISELNEEGKRVGFIIDTDLEEKEFVKTINTYFNEEFTNGNNYNSNYISPTLSNSFFTQAIYTLIISFILMSFVIFIYFREVIPSTAVVLSAIFDIIVTVGILNFLEFKISVAGIGALLMLVGYSIDTDVLLTNRLIKEHGKNYFEKTFDAFKTGVLMSSTTLIAAISAMILTNSEVIFEITLIMTIGLLVDFISTWIQNSAILLWWLEK